MDNKKKLDYLKEILSEYQAEQLELELKIHEKRSEKEKLELLLNIIDKGSSRIDLTRESNKVAEEYQEAKKNLQAIINETAEERTVLQSIIENTEEEINKVTNVTTI